MKTNILKLAGCALILAGLAGVAVCGVMAVTMYSGFTPDSSAELAGKISSKLAPIVISGSVGSALLLVGVILALVGRRQKQHTPIEAQRV